MARKKAETEATTEVSSATATETSATEQEKKYPLSRLADYCQKLFGVPSSTFAGATASLDANGRYSKSEVAATIKQWKEKEAK